MSYKTQSSFYTFTIFTAALSSFLSFIASLLNYYYSYNKKSRYHTLVTLLILCDGIGSLCFVIWTTIDEISHHHHSDICQYFLPFPTFFFLLSFCWTSLIAHRFKEICKVNKFQKDIDLPLWTVPFFCIILILPTVILNAQGIVVSETISPVSGGGLDFCFFSSSTTAFIVNIATFQIPSLLTVIYNIRCYYVGIQSLRLSPEHVMEREIKRARNYLIVLLITWVPNLCVNLYHFIFLPQHKEPYFPVQALVLLTSLQGFINFAVYLWGYKPFQVWLSSLIFLRNFIQLNPPNEEDMSDRGSSLVNGLLLTQAEEEGDDNDYDNNNGNGNGEKENMRKSILGGSGRKSESRQRIASGERAVRFEEKHECRYYDDESNNPTESSAFMPKLGYYPDNYNYNDNDNYNYIVKDV